MRNRSVEVCNSHEQFNYSEIILGRAAPSPSLVHPLKHSPPLGPLSGPTTIPPSHFTLLHTSSHLMPDAAKYITKHLETNPCYNRYKAALGANPTKGILSVLMDYGRVVVRGPDGSSELRAAAAGKGRSRNPDLFRLGQDDEGKWHVSLVLSDERTARTLWAIADGFSRPLDPEAAAVQGTILDRALTDKPDVSAGGKHTSCESIDAVAPG